VIGNLVGNRYEIISQLGGGGMALVYKARDTLLNRQVTVKILRSEHTGDEGFISNFRKEAQAVAKLSHPNIVNVYDVGKEGDTQFIVMEYVEGRNLKQFIKEQGRLPLNQAADIARQICDGLQDAHTNGIVHRDIKPHNILVTDNGKVKVADFGIAQIMSSVTLTNSGTIVGSVHYFSPEQARGDATGAKSDIYAVGVVLYEMVTGKVPFEGETPIAVALKHIQEKPLPPSKLNAQVSPELERIILRAMEKEVTMRYKTAGDMARDLRKLNGESVDNTIAVDSDEFATRVMGGPLIITKGKGQEDDDEPAYRKKRKKMRPLVKMVIVTIILGLLAGAGYGLNWFFNVPEVRVPDVRNMSLEDARKKLQENKLDLEIPVWINNPDVPQNNVISQEPAPNGKVRQGYKILLTVSQGPGLATVPDVVKKELEAATVEIENAEFKVFPSEDFSSDVPAGSVISQTPEGNTQAVKGSTVKLVVSKGVEPKPVVVPNIVGKSLEEASAVLEAVKLKLSSDITQKASTEYLSGTIISQDPAENGELQKGGEVKVTLSKGPGPEPKTARVGVEIPNDGLTHKVKIVVNDISTRTAYEAEHNSGEVFTKIVTYYNSGKIQVFIDDMSKPVKSQLVE